MKKTLSIIFTLAMCILMTLTFSSCGETEDGIDPFLLEAQALIREDIENARPEYDIYYINERWGKPTKEYFSDATVEEEALGGHLKSYFDHHYMFSIELFLVDSENNFEYHQLQYQYYILGEEKYLNDNSILSYPIIDSIYCGEIEGETGYLTKYFSIYDKISSMQSFYYSEEEDKFVTPVDYYGSEESANNAPPSELIDLFPYHFQVTLDRDGGKISNIYLHRDYSGEIKIPEILGGAPIISANLSYLLFANESQTLTSQPSLRLSKSISSIEYEISYFGEELVLNRYNQIVVEEGNKVYDSRDNSNCLIKTDENKVLILGKACTAIPETVISINSNAYSYDNEITEIILPLTVAQIGSIENCENLKYIILNNAKMGAINNCPNLEYVMVTPVGANDFPRNIYNSPKMQTIYIAYGEDTTFMEIFYCILDDCKSYYAIYSEESPENMEAPEGFNEYCSLDFSEWKTQYRWWHYDTDGVTPVLW